MSLPPSLRWYSARGYERLALGAEIRRDECAQRIELFMKNWASASAGGHGRAAQMWASQASAARLGLAEEQAEMDHYNALHIASLQAEAA